MTITITAGEFTYECKDHDTALKIMFETLHKENIPLDDVRVSFRVSGMPASVFVATAYMIQQAGGKVL